MKNLRQGLATLIVGMIVFNIFPMHVFAVEDQDTLSGRFDIQAEVEIAVSNTSTDYIANRADAKLLHGTLSMDTQNIEIGINQDGQTIDYQLAGHLYPFTEGKYAGIRLVGEFENLSKSNSVTVSTVKINTVDPASTIEIVLENTQEKQVYVVTGEISKSGFAQLYESALANKEAFLANKDVTRLDYLDKIVQLDVGLPSESSVASNEPQTTGTDSIYRVQEDFEAIPTRASLTTLGDFSYSQLNNTIRALRSGSLSLSSYGISPTFFTTTGFQHNTNYNNFFASKYTSSGENGTYLTRLSVVAVVETWHENTQQARLQLLVESGIMIQYVPGSNTASIYLDDYGLRFRNVQTKLDNLRGNENNIFTSSEISGDVNSFSVRVPTLIGLVSKTKFLATAWNAFQTVSTNSFGAGVQYFDNTVTAQSNRYSGKVIRGIALNSGAVYMQSQGQRMVLTGEMSINGSATWDWAYSYTAATV